MKLRVLVAHNHYQQPGGEDEVYASEAECLEAFGHEVVRYALHNNQVREMSPLPLAAATFWNQQTYREVRDLVRQHRIEVAHFHNTFPLISPSAYSAAHAEGAAVVQTLHNFRLLCINATLFRHGRVCERCVGRTSAWPGVVYGCYRGSWGASAVAATAMATHWALGTWKHAVDLFIAPSEFACRKLVEGGLPALKVIVKPNCIHPDPGCGDGNGGYAVFVGRLSQEKGLRTLLQAWSRLSPGYPLKIVGDGPLRDQARQAAARSEHIEWLGHRPLAEVGQIVGQASLLVVPSESYETFGRVIIEAFAKGTPVIASRLGAITELVDDGRTGLLFHPGDPNELALQVRTLLDDPTRLASMRQAARATFTTRYNGTRSIEGLTAIYEQAIAGFRREGTWRALAAEGTGGMP